MKIEAVVVCKDYGDFLAHTLPENIEQLDRMVVVTHPADTETKELCRHHSVDVVETEVFHEDGDRFNKWRALNLGLSHLKHDGWVLVIDADIMLPHKFRDMLNRAKLDTKNLYGADRLNTGSFENWQAHAHTTVPQHRWRYLVHPTPEFPVGARLLHAEYGYLPIGYFQLWHSSQHRQYPIHNGSAEHGDVLFAVQWARERRILLPELFVYHLESDGDAPMGTNWKGRKTKRFGHCHHHHHHDHRHHCHHHPHCKHGGEGYKPHCECHKEK